MRIFLSAGEPSGDLHGASFARALRELCPGVDLVGFGGARMAEAGCRILYPLSELAVMGIGPILAHIPELYRVLGKARNFFREHRPDAVVLIDYPGFHWWLAGCARKLGVPVVYAVPPQLWAWAGWRVRKMRRLTDRVLCNLPFEEEWYRQRGVAAEYVGHPYFDELLGQRLDDAFLAQQRARPGPVVAVLPGSRRQELRCNLASQLRACALVRARRPDVRFLAACLKPEHARQVAAEAERAGVPVEAHHGRTAEIIELAHSCLSVSGSVSLELLFRGKPSTILYRVSPPGRVFAWLALNCKYITLVNLLAGRELFPEYLQVGCPAEAQAGNLLRWLNDPLEYAALRAELAELRGRVAAPGACARAARAILDVAGERARRAA
jgi:lipid-A-disaccharide synthase